ncbi:hypothetical protein [Prauserella muralis]|uniref:Uncharacterized protein n=1 Tax=Prauserella muralis TaxID=588067 RepID=A0A2V4AHK1_9PSEU|nr:hypothetical protein [Prauserella muralis]PXY19385.1 hypothetical protein BAY60_32060 [Prauserella muralis]TWE29352.1 hypothetical protein FHX69_2036 [Prauserella muralis]
MSRIRHFLGTPFGLAVLACAVVAGWALWTGGLFDGALRREVRSSSVYAAEGVELDEGAAERIIGNRRLVVAFLEPGSDLAAGCDDAKGAADGNLVLLLSQGSGRDEQGDDYDAYGCALFPDADDENLGKALVAENLIRSGIDQFPDRPLEALKVIVVNYDLLVKAGTVADGARTISPSLPRYLIAAAALGGVVAGAASLYLTARRAGRIAVRRRERRDAAADARSVLSAGAAVLAQQIIDLDHRFALLTKRDRTRRHELTNRYRAIVSDYTALLDALSAAGADDEAELRRLTERIDRLAERCRRLAAQT